MKKALSLFLLFFVVILLGAKCSDKQQVQKNYKDISSSEANQILLNTAADLGWDSDQIKMGSDEYYPAQMVYKEYATLYIRRVTEEHEDTFASMYDLNSFNLDTFTHDLCEKNKNKLGAFTETFKIKGYDACYFSGESSTGPFEGINVVVGNYILVSHTPPHPQEYKFIEEENAYVLVPIPDWSWDNKEVTQVLVDNFLEKYKSN